MKRIADERAYFFEHIERIPEAGCWIWMGALKDRNGYGKMGSRQYLVMTHRFSWIIHNGPITEDQCVLHRCDIPCCVNPAHLFLGTRSDNCHDMFSKRRHLRSDGTWKMSKLTADQIRSIRVDPRPQLEIAKDHGTYRETISMIKSRKIYAGVPD